MSHFRKFLIRARTCALLTIAASALSLSAVSPAFAVTTLSIGNGTSLLDGSYLNAQDIADNLVFTSILVQSTTSITIVDQIDMSSSTFGTPVFTLTLTSPVCNISNDLTIAALGHLNLNCGTLNLNGKITSGGTPIDPSRVTGAATQVNVQSNKADIQQAIDFSSHTSAPAIAVSSGQYLGNLAVARPLTLSGNDGTNPTGADPTAPTLNGTVPGGNVVTVTGNGVTIDGLHLNGLVNGGSSTASVNGVVADNVDGFTASHNSLDGFTGPGFDTTGSTNVSLNANYIVLPPPTVVPVAVSGSQTYGSASPSFSYMANPPAGVTVSGVLNCTTVDGGSSIVATLGAGAHTIDAASCSGLSVSDANHYALSYTSETSDFSVRTAGQTVAFTTTAPANAVVGGSVYAPTAAATSNLPATITVDPAASTTCHINNGDVSFQNAGTCVLDANQAGNANFDAAPQVQQSFAVTAAATAYTWSGFLQPINADSSSIFKLGRTVPVKFQLVGNSAGMTNLQAKLYVGKVSSSTTGSVVEAISNAASDTGNTFRYDATGQQYVFNLSTQSLTAGTYKLQVYANGDNNTGILLGAVNISLGK